MQDFSNRGKKRASIIALAAFVFAVMMFVSPKSASAYSEWRWDSTSDNGSSASYLFFTGIPNGNPPYATTTDAYANSNAYQIRVAGCGSVPTSFIPNDSPCAISSSNSSYNFITPESRIVINWGDASTTGDYIAYVGHYDSGTGGSLDIEAQVSFHWDAPTKTPTFTGTTGLTNTRIESVTPISGSTIATSTTASFGAQVYVNDADFHSGQFVRISFQRNQDNQTSVSNPALVTTTFDFPDLTASGFTTVSTTTNIQRTGAYTMKVDIRRRSIVNNVLDFFGLGSIFDASVMVSTTTDFTVVQPTAYDNFIASTTDSISNFLASSTVSTAACTSFLSFNFLDCMSLIFTWQDAPMKVQLDKLKTTLFAFAPWGYLTRTVTIISSTGSTSIPAFSYTFPASFPSATFASKTFAFNPWQYFDSYKDYVSSNDGKNIWEIVQNFFTTFCWLLLAFMIFNDLTKLHSGGIDDNSRESQIH